MSTINIDKREVPATARNKRIYTTSITSISNISSSGGSGGSLTETDTLDSVTTRGANTLNDVSVGNITVIGGTDEIEKIDFVDEGVTKLSIVSDNNITGANYIDSVNPLQLKYGGSTKLQLTTLLNLYSVLNTNSQIISTVTGAAPFQISSSYLNTNLNADMLDGKHASDFALAGSGGSGSVTSVGLSMPTIFSVTNSPVTGSGTLIASLVNQTANKVLASPNGSTGEPTFRNLTELDIPLLSAYAAAPIYSRLTTNHTTTSTSLTSITGLALALQANSYYEIEIVLGVNSSSQTGCGYGLNWSSINAYIEAQISGTNTITGSKCLRFTNFNASVSPWLTAAVSTAVAGGIMIKGIITTTNAGTVTVQHHKVTSGTSTVYLNSYIKATKVGVVGGG